MSVLTIAVVDMIVQEAHQPVDGPLRVVTVIEMQQIPDDTLWS